MVGLSYMGFLMTRPLVLVWAGLRSKGAGNMMTPHNLCAICGLYSSPTTKSPSLNRKLSSRVRMYVRCAKKLPGQCFGILFLIRVRCTSNACSTFARLSWFGGASWDGVTQARKTRTRLEPALSGNSGRCAPTVEIVSPEFVRCFARWQNSVLHIA